MGAGFFPCTGNSDCPICESGHRASKKRMAYAVVDNKGICLQIAEEEYLSILWRALSNYPFSFGI